MKIGVDYIGVTVNFFCYDRKGNLLLQKRSNKARDEHNRWDCGGGAVRFGETFEEAVKREMKEEYCCVPIKLDFAGVNNVLRVNQGIKTHWVCLIYAVLVDPKRVKIGDKKKIDDLRWFRKNKLPKPLHSMYINHLKFIERYIR